jgi:DNA-binding response OmpR family regulator
MNKILVLDRDESVQLLFEEELTEEGYQVITTGDCSRLLACIGEQRPDLIVMEIGLGEYDGLDLLVDIRNTYYNLPVILCTAHPSFRYDLRSIAADYYVLKSSDLCELKSKIRMALEGGAPPPHESFPKDILYEQAPMEQFTLPWENLN